VAVLAGLAGCSGMTPFVGKQIENSRTIDPSGIDDLMVDLEGGDVTLQAAERQDLAIEYVKKSSSVQVDLSKLHFRTTRSGGTLSLHSEWNGGDNPFGRLPIHARERVAWHRRVGSHRARHRLRGRGDVPAGHPADGSDGATDEPRRRPGRGLQHPRRRPVCGRTKGFEIIS
jgi:hypothetical protein